MPNSHFSATVGHITNMENIIPILTSILLFITLYFEVFMLISLLEKRPFGRNIQNIFPEPHALPKVCIAVPCYNEESTVGITIESLLALDYPKHLLEITVVDDGSTDGTHTAATQYAHDPRIKIFQKENGGKHSALNVALANTDAEFVGCLDADSYVIKDALMLIISVFTNKNVAAVTPGIHIQQPKNLLQHMQKAEYRLGVFTRAAFADMGSVFITPGPFSIFRTNAVRSVGGWKHAHSTEDLELGLRLQETGHTIRNQPFAAVFTKTPSTIRTLIHQRVRWSYGFLRNAIDYRHMIGNLKYGNLGILALPIALFSVAAVLYFAVLMTYKGITTVTGWVSYVLTTHSIGTLSFDLFYFNTSMLGIAIYFSIAIILLLIMLGSHISGTTKDHVLLGLPIFILFYGFFTVAWFSIAVARATFKTGVRWR